MHVPLVYPYNLLILTWPKVTILLHHIKFNPPWILVSLIVILECAANIIIIFHAVFIISWEIITCKKEDKEYANFKKVTFEW